MTTAAATRPGPTAAQLDARQATADRRARELDPAVTRLAPDRYAVASARHDAVYRVVADPDGIRCSCPAGEAGLPCYHASAVIHAVAAGRFAPAPSSPAKPGRPARACFACGDVVEHGRWLRSLLYCQPCAAGLAHTIRYGR